jgi:hypothetical protein
MSDLVVQIFPIPSQKSLSLPLPLRASRRANISETPPVVLINEQGEEEKRSGTEGKQCPRSGSVLSSVQKSHFYVVTPVTFQTK